MLFVQRQTNNQKVILYVFSVIIILFMRHFCGYCIMRFIKIMFLIELRIMRIMRISARPLAIRETSGPETRVSLGVALDMEHVDVV